MFEHLTQKQVEAYCRRQLPVAELLPVSDHLGECEACRHQIEQAMRDDAAFFALRSAVFGETAEISSSPVRAHLTAEQTADYVDHNLSGEALQTIVDHLSHCETCALAVDDLNAFKDQVAPSLEHDYHPAALASPAEGWWQRTVDSLSALFRRTPALVYGFVLAITLLAVAGWLIWRTPRAGEPEQAVDVSPAPQAPQAPPAALPPQPASVSVVAQLNDGGGQLTLDQQGKLSGADGLPPAYQRMLKEALTTKRIERSSQLKGLSRPSSTLMSADKQASEFSVLDPVGNVLMSDRPTFRWSPLAGASAYVVEVYDSKFNLVTTSPELTGHSWEPSQAFARGEVYSWQVKASKDGQEFKSPQPPAPQARFRILDQAKAGELAKAKRDYASSHLTLGLLYAEAGLLKEAEQELRALEKANPESEIARRLLSQIQALGR